MFTILLHTSKTMRAGEGQDSPVRLPNFIEQADCLARYIQSLTPRQLATCMKLTDAKAASTHALWQKWKSSGPHQLPAIDSFIGDIYSGLQAHTFSEEDRAYANDYLYILSGLYGILRALDSISPYRLEMGYRLPDEPYRNLYKFWGGRIARQLPTTRPIINVSAVEYTKAVLPYMQHAPVITPKFMTLDKAGQPRFVVVHAKIARGAFARWLIQNRIGDTSNIRHFSDLNYKYDIGLSTPEQPVFVCKEFGGLGLSIRLHRIQNLR